MVFPSTTGVSVRVLRPMFVPGCGGPHEFVSSVSFSHFLPAVIPFPLSLWFSFIISSPNHPRPLLSRSLATFVSLLPPHSLPSFIYILPFLFLPPSSSFYPSLLFFPPSSSSLLLPSALLLASKVPWEPCGSSAGRHTNTTAATAGTSLFSLSSPSHSLAPFFSSSLSSLSLSLFSSSLFNVEVLSNCWLLLWLGGNGIFRRMPHAVASIHSWVPPNHTHTLEHTNIGGYGRRISTLMCTSLDSKNADNVKMHAKTRCHWWMHERFKLRSWVCKRYKDVTCWPQAWSCTAS